ncbi:RagB/SusD family nutrient uptake outer membrane protein [Dysgonomonas sp. ZJ279]|uniref:RagB/SusD family nutrient uptake outer membrane protein n=1 Tax=Dysgonomonas sp. ZJ279 TaxID=2709796 RepID=UPI0013EC7805|nr:RagB/SusD family nutrient uptake outer membrane protein [Dysgonomonas sp. ZJ279]
MNTIEIIKNTASIIVLSTILVMTGCNDDVLDRPQLANPDDDTYWTSEDNLRLYANEYYAQFFPGYNTGFVADYTPIRGLTFNDDVVNSNRQALFEISVPNTRGSNNNTTGETSSSGSAPAWLSEYNGPTWYFGWIRKSNVMLNRMDTRMTGILTTEAYNHWTAVARFFRALDYCRLVSVFGDVPYMDRLVTTIDNDILYQDRTARNDVMDAIYTDFEYVLDNIRASDGNQYVNKDIAAAFISRWMLFEGTWQKYQKGDNARAKKFLDFSVKASELIMGSKYEIDGDFRSLFGSEDLSKNKECILYRTYDAALGVTHAIASYNNLTENQAFSANLSLVKSFICSDGKPWQNSTVANAKSFSISDLQKSRDPRFEATFWDQPREQAAGLLYTVKFIDRVGPTYADKGDYPPKYTSQTNTNDAPIIRYAEILLNWIEAKAELATLGGSAVSQGDIERSINAIRNRELAPEAIDKGVTKTVPMNLGNLPNDPSRDANVPALIWEIRRERRMELYAEQSRLLDIKRWKKINYMDGVTNPDLLRSIWVDIPNEIPILLTETKINVTQVQKEDGTIVVFNGTNQADMVGYYLPENVANRDPFTDRVYLAPIGKNQIDLYKAKGYTLTQTPGW